MGKIYLIGIGYKPLDKKAQEIIHGSDVIVASGRLFEVFKGYGEFEAVRERVRVINNVDETIAFIKTESYKQEQSGRLLHKQRQARCLHHNIVLLASGDPMFFGIGRRVMEEFGKDMVEILPDLSSVQLAFSRIKEAWNDAFLMSLHGGPDPEKRRRLAYEIDDIPCLLQQHHKIAILTDRENNPAEIAKSLSAFSLQPSAFKMFVCERLGYSDERVVEGTAEEIAGMSFGEPNVVIILQAGCLHHNGQQPEVRLGLTEDEISHSRGLITKDEVRAVTIHKLRMPQTGVFWDIGAGSGSVSVEIARMYPALRIFAVEKDEEQINHLRENKGRFNAVNMEIINGEAPDILADLLPPDRVFVGGSGGRLKEIISLASSLSCPHIVVNATTIETLNQAIDVLEANDFRVEVVELSVARGRSVSGKRHLSALNPVFIITGETLMMVRQKVNFSHKDTETTEKTSKATSA